MVKNIHLLTKEASKTISCTDEALKNILNGIIRYEGEFKDGLYDGTGILYRIKTSEVEEIEYKGNFKQNKRCGSGTSYKKSGEIDYEGSWKNDKKDGAGKYYIKG